jgi:hypothetical protein
VKVSISFDTDMDTPLDVERAGAFLRDLADVATTRQLGRPINPYAAPELHVSAFGERPVSMPGPGPFGFPPAPIRPPFAGAPPFGDDDEDPPDLPEPPAVDNSRVEEGARAFEKLIRTWITNFQPDLPPGESSKLAQPDRAGALMGAFAGYGKAIGAYIRSRGGMAGAVTDTLLTHNMSGPEGVVRLGKQVALNIVQVGSTLALPLDQLLERSVQEAPEIDGSVPRGGIASDTIDYVKGHPLLDPKK